MNFPLFFLILISILQCHLGYSASIPQPSQSGATTPLQVEQVDEYYFEYYYNEDTDLFQYEQGEPDVDVEDELTVVNVELVSSSSVPHVNLNQEDHQQKQDLQGFMQRMEQNLDWMLSKAKNVGISRSTSTSSDEKTSVIYVYEEIVQESFDATLLEFAAALVVLYLVLNAILSSNDDEDEQDEKLPAYKEKEEI